MRNLNLLRAKKWGVFCHFLPGILNCKESPYSMGKETSWDECVADFDCERFAKSLHEAGAGYAVLTLLQANKYLVAPNATFDRIAGYQPGEACAKIDLVERMLAALEPYGIELILYFTGDGPSNDEQACKAFDACRNASPVTLDFVKKWAEVAREYSMRYGKRVAGWWLDGAFRYIGYDEEKLAILHAGVRAGNPDALVATNYEGCYRFGTKEFYHEVQAPAPGDDYTAGEMVLFGDMPPRDRELPYLWNVTSFLGQGPSWLIHDGWADTFTRYSGGFMHEYVQAVNERGGVVTIGIALYRDGHLDPEQESILRQI